MTDKEILNKAVKFLIFSLPDTHAFDIFVEAAKIENGKAKYWHISTTGEFIWFMDSKRFALPYASNRDEQCVIALTCFDKLKDAITEAQKIAAIYDKKYKKWIKDGKKGWFHPWDQ
jgi:hypothetical protein